MSITVRAAGERLAARYWLARKTGETEEECERVLASLRRATTARVHTFEMDNDARYNTPKGIAYLERRHAREEKTFARLAAWLDVRGVDLRFYGLRPTLVIRSNGSTIEGLGW